MKILEVELLSDNLDTTAEFYANALGLEIIEKTADLLSIKIGFSTLVFKRSINLQPVYHIAFNIPENTLDEALIWVSSKTAIVPASADSQIAEFSAWNARAFYFYDNNGNVLEFIARFDLQQTTAAPFTSEAISCISEIAIVTENVRKYSSQLSKLTGIQPYEKQPLHDNFAALGDAHGLFIISEEGRNWYPTNNPSKKFPVRIKIQSGEIIRELSLNEETG
jgi:catechol-2,3-dioxygenase